MRNKRLITKYVSHAILVILLVMSFINVVAVQRTFYNTWFFDHRGDFENLCRASHSPYADGTVLCYYSKEIYGENMGNLVLPEENNLRKIIGKYHPGISELFIYPGDVIYRAYDYTVYQKSKKEMTDNPIRVITGKYNIYRFFAPKQSEEPRDYAVYMSADGVVIMPFMQESGKKE